MYGAPGVDSAEANFGYHKAWSGIWAKLWVLQLLSQS